MRWVVNPTGKVAKVPDQAWPNPSSGDRANTMELKKCRDCGVPLYLSRNYRWKEGGYILAARDPDSRMVKAGVHPVIERPPWN